MTTRKQTQGVDNTLSKTSFVSTPLVAFKYIIIFFCKPIRENLSKQELHKSRLIFYSCEVRKSSFPYNYLWEIDAI